MAEALVGVAFEKLLNLLQSELATFLGVKQNTEQLSSNLELIKAVLDDAEEKQWTNRSIKVWLQQLKNAAYVLDDILDECPTESLQHGRLSSFKPKNILFRYGVGRKLNEMIRELDRIAEAKNKFVLREGVRERPTEVAEWRQTSSTIAQPQVYGRDEDEQKVVEFLLSPARGSDFLSVYPIVGLGGLGKTTLAQLVYNDQGVSNHFDLKIWVCVSENFTVERILCSVIESIMEEKYNILDLDVMERKVQELLQSKRYLLVLDDVWKTNQEFEFGLSEDKWDKLKAVLSCGSQGASILVTTRDNEVAEIMGTCQAHHLSRLSDDDCWSLFKQRAFGPNEEERAELVEIGREIVEKCGGSPLAAKALGASMRSRREKKEWLEVKESKLWTLPDGNNILSALRLSYFHLTPTLKQCFSFCAIFPKDTEIMKEDLIHLWMSNGFISSRENLDVEEVGNMIWNELYQKSFFQDVRTSDDLGNICFKMHDLVHDLAQSITEQECVCLEKMDLIELSRNTHHVGFGCGYETSFNKGACKKVESLRTLYQLECGRWPRISGWFPTNRSLRVLRTNSFELSLLGNLIHLRYLELHDLEIESFPDSIYNLHKLEILKLINIRSLCRLPKHLTCLQHLRHLVVSGCDSLSCMFPNIHKLSHMRTLSLYIVKTETGHSLAELRDLKLGGKLEIKRLGNGGSLSEAQEANLKGKEDLRELKLSWTIIESQAPTVGEIFEALQPPSSLEVLIIYFYEGLHWPRWMENNSILGNLVYLKLFRCGNCRRLPSLGKLMSLRKLEIDDMDFVQYMDDDECYDGAEVRAFPSLEKLDLEGLPNLERLLKLERGDMFPLLSDLSVSRCPKLQLPCLPCVKRLRVWNCTNELLGSISSFSGLEDLVLSGGEDMTSFPEGMMNNLNCLKNLEISFFPKLKELPYEITKPNALKSLNIVVCHVLESLPEQVLQGLSSLRHLGIVSCDGLSSLPEGVRHLSLEVLEIEDCPRLAGRCREGREDWHKIKHIPKVLLRRG